MRFVHLYVADMSNFSDLNRLYIELFPHNPPGGFRVGVPVDTCGSAPHLGFLFSSLFCGAFCFDPGIARVCVETCLPPDVAAALDCVAFKPSSDELQG